MQIHEPPNQKENYSLPLIPKCMLLECMLYLISRNDTHKKKKKAAMCQNYYACILECGSRKYKPFHTPYTSAFASTQRTFTRQIEHSCSVLLFMRHAVRGTLHTLTLRAFTLRAVVVFLLLGDGASSSDGPHLPRVPALQYL